ncbi:MAG: hemolysin III family protein [Bacteroidales bacterium]|nr:hemolysin III family protein [Bacteroidales bacterium]
MPINTDKFTFGEELANAISHVAGAALSIVALILMTVFASKNGTSIHVISAVVFGVSLFLLYSWSGIMHWLPVGKAKMIFRKFDQIGIFILIAGTYTPFALLAIKGTMGWIILGIEWGLALIGIVIRSIQKDNIEENVSLFYVIMYIMMGWIIVIDIKHILQVIDTWGLVFLFGGGLFYTLGVVFFRMHKVRYHHLVWHIFVLLGSIMHFFAIYFFVLPLK